MKKILSNIFIMLFILLFIFLILISSSNVFEVVNTSFKIWINSVFPSLFPFFVLSDILINYGFVDLISKYFKKIMNSLFKISGNGSFIFFMSLVSGCPSNAKYTKELLDKDMIDEKEASKILLFTHFSNPLFILGTVAVAFLKSYKVGLIILIIHYFTNIIIGIVFRNYNKVDIDNDNKTLKDIFYKENNFGLLLSRAIINSINTLLLILGTITIFLIFTNVINQNININLYFSTFINSFIEMTQGLNYVSILNLSMKAKAILSVMILSFGGFSVHMQVMSIISDYDIKYLPYLLARLLHAGISGLIMYFIFDIVI